MDRRVLWALRILAGTPALVLVVALGVHLRPGPEPQSDDWNLFAAMTVPYLVTVALLRPRTWKLGLRLAQFWGGFVAVMLSIAFLFSLGDGIPTVPLVATAVIWHAALSRLAWREYQGITPKSRPPAQVIASPPPAGAGEATVVEPVTVDRRTLWKLRLLAVGPILALAAFLASEAKNYPQATVLVVALWLGLVIPYLAVLLTLRPKTLNTGLTGARNLGATGFIVLIFSGFLGVADRNTLILWGVAVWHGVMYWIAKRAQTKTSA